jgi:hypothetical protein
MDRGRSNRSRLEHTEAETIAPADSRDARSPASRALRDAVREARTRIDAAAEPTAPPVDITTTRYEPGEARAALDTALVDSEPGHQSVDGDLEP